MKYRVVWKPSAGLTTLSRPGDAGMKYLSFGMISLSSGQAYRLEPGSQETALVLLRGEVLVSGGGLVRQAIGPRADLFHEKPWTVLVRAETAVDLEATRDSEIAVCQAPSTRPGPAMVLPPDRVKEVSLGKPGFQRLAWMMVTEEVPADYLFIGEAIVPPANWASFPPHRHDFDDLPNEVDMEEVYYFRFDRPRGFGIQKIYTDNRSIDETYTVEDHHTVLIPEGYHPVAAAPGYSMYYLWIMAGKNRRFFSRPDPDHGWIAQASSPPEK
ncbi:MAG: 5-deoxy-glucuronate isomerase [Thermoguttaceae bacterium]